MSTTRFAQFKKAIRNALISRIGSIVVNDWPDYQARVNKVIQYHYASWEKAVGEAALAHKEHGEGEEYDLKQAAAIEARAAFMDAMREYLQIDLSRSDHGLPIRVPSYEYKDVELTTRHVGSDIPVKTVQRVLFKTESSEIPALNYPTPYWRGKKLEQIEQYLRSIVKLSNEAAAKQHMLTEQQILQAKIDAGMVTGTAVDKA